MTMKGKTKTRGVVEYGEASTIIDPQSQKISIKTCIGQNEKGQVRQGTPNIKPALHA